MHKLWYKKRSSLHGSGLFAASNIKKDDKTQNSIKRVLKKKFGRKVELQVEVDESVIGGLSVSVGERTFDGLVSSRLQEVKSVLEGR